MKKALSFVLSSVLILSTLAGCGNQSESSNTTNASTTSTSVVSNTGAEKSDSGEITNIIWQYPTPGNTGTGFQDVENAFNAMLEKDGVGVKVKFELVPLMESQKRAQLMASAGEQLDISLTAFTSLGPLVESDLIQPLDELVDKYGQGIKEACGESLKGGSYAGKLYGIPPADKQGAAYGYLASTELLKKYGITVDDKKKYTFDELDQIFNKVKAGEGKNFYCEIPWNTTPEPMNNGYIEYDKVAGAIGNGVLMLNRGFDTKKIENIFATDEYKKYAEMKYRWAQKGYISPDAAITKEAPDSIMQTKRYLGMFYWADPATRDSYTPTAGFDLTLLHLTDPYVACNGGKIITWNIPITSASPEKAMKALNYLYSNYDANKLIQFGLEGKSYKVLQKKDNTEQIEYLDKDTAKLPYYNPYGLWGNILSWPAVAPSPIEKNQTLKAWDAAIPNTRYSPAIGYSFVQTSVATEIAAVQTVVNQYTPGFNCGALDPAKSLPEFLKALKAAGVDKIISENQKQYDEWLKNKK
jgi:putative aldouronate transport system substrate-binding protein